MDFITGFFESIYKLIREVLFKYEGNSQDEYVWLDAIFGIFFKNI